MLAAIYIEVTYWDANTCRFVLAEQNWYWPKQAKPYIHMRDRNTRDRVIHEIPSQTIRVVKCIYSSFTWIRGNNHHHPRGSRSQFFPDPQYVQPALRSKETVQKFHLNQYSSFKQQDMKPLNRMYSEIRKTIPKVSLDRCSSLKQSTKQKSEIITPNVKQNTLQFLDTESSENKLPS